MEDVIGCNGGEEKGRRGIGEGLRGKWEPG